MPPEAAVAPAFGGTQASVPAPAPEAKAYAIRENDGAFLSVGHFKQTETLLPLLVIRRPIAAMIVADETDGLVVADDAPRQDMGIGRTSVGLGGRR